MINWIVDTSSAFWNKQVRPRYDTIGAFENYNPKDVEHIRKMRATAATIIEQINKKRKVRDMPNPAEFYTFGPFGLEAPITPPGFGPYGEEEPVTPQRTTEGGFFRRGENLGPWQ